ncbi:MAG: hypothetical protein FuHV1_gp2 [Hangzhou hepevirus 1]|nr:MAG: hypothetical protein FuHV1_gp2 [Hangzhou hepevirus 1]
MSEDKALRVVLVHMDKVLSSLDTIIKLLEKGGGQLDYRDVGKNIASIYKDRNLDHLDEDEYIMYQTIQYGHGIRNGIESTENADWKFNDAANLAYRHVVSTPVKHYDQGNLVLYTDSIMADLRSTSLNPFSKFVYDSDPTGGTQ